MYDFTRSQLIANHDPFHLQKTERESLCLFKPGETSVQCFFGLCYHLFFKIDCFGSAN